MKGEEGGKDKKRVKKNQNQETGWNGCCSGTEGMREMRK